MEVIGNGCVFVSEIPPKSIRTVSASDKFRRKRNDTPDVLGVAAGLQGLPYEWSCEAARAEGIIIRLWTGRDIDGMHYAPNRIERVWGHFL